MLLEPSYSSNWHQLTEWWIESKAVFFITLFLKSFPKETVSAVSLFLSLSFFFSKFFSFLTNFYVLCPVSMVFDSRREIITFHNNWSLGRGAPNQCLSWGSPSTVHSLVFPARYFPFQHACALESDTARAALPPVWCSLETIPSLSCPRRLQIFKPDSTGSRKDREI